MIDTIFFLLVFIMISTMSMSRCGGLTVSLPEAATGQQPRSESAALTIDPDGKIAIDKGAVPRHLVGDILKTRLAATSALLVIINADERVEHGLIVEVMDQAREAGAAMAIAVRPKESRRER